MEATHREVQDDHLAVLAAAAVALGACSDRSEPAAPTTTAVKVLYVGAQQVKPKHAGVSGECAEHLSDARTVIADNDYLTNLDFDGVVAIKAALENRLEDCTPGETAASAEEVAAWRAPTPPTYVEERYAELSTKCTEALEEPRVQLRPVPAGATGPEMVEAIETANAALEECSPVEKGAVHRGGDPAGASAALRDNEGRHLTEADARVYAHRALTEIAGAV